jgi:subtilisin family serine protease
VRVNVRGVLVVLGLAVALATTLASAQAGAAPSSDRYIVQLADAPLATYRGGVAGLAATSPAVTGAVKLDPESAASKAYLSYLDTKRDAVLSAASTALGRTATPSFTYRYAYNGFALSLTEGEAALLRGVAGVARVQKEFTRQLLTDAGPEWIGAPGVWNGSTTGAFGETKGERVVVGVIDTGINHDHPSFADKGGDGYDHKNPRGRFYGACDPLTGLPFCNDKLIGVWDFTGTTPLDDNQHGSHTASTAAGNALTATLRAPTITVDRKIAGVAPHANLITYKACIAVGCMGASLTAAIDQAVADAVDVINYSIGGGPSNPWGDSDSEAFLAAREAGVFVAASAGNSGPNGETVGSPANAPWLLSVGASTHNRSFVNTLTGLSGGGSAAPGTLTGKSLTGPYGPAKIVYAGDYGAPLCGSGPAAATGDAAVNPFPPGTFDGEIVVCDRGVYGRVEKASNVAEGGAGGFVLANDQASGGSTVGDAYPIPGVGLSYLDGVKLKEWLKSGTGHTGSIGGTVADTAAKNGDVMASFSSRGPNKPVPGIVKPDITGPGVDVLAAVHTVDPTKPAEYGVLSGTSMSSPHLAGVAALMRALHGNWTPAEIHSAIVTTATHEGVRKEDGLRPADPFDMGGGRVDLSVAPRAGLTLDVPAGDFAAANPEEGGDPSALNLGTLGEDDCDASCSWTRTVKNRTGATTTWRLGGTGPSGLRWSFAPAEFTLAPGATQTVTITADVSKLSVGRWNFGAVTFTPSSTGVPATRLAVALRTAKPVPVDVVTNSTQGATIVTTTAKVDITRFSTVISGLTQGREDSFLLEQDPTPTEGPYDVPVGTKTFLVDVPEGSRFLATDIVSTDSLDLDLFVGRDSDNDGKAEAAEEMCSSASETAMESCRLSNLPGGKYWIVVQNWLGLGASTVELATAVIPGVDNGNLTATGPKGPVKAGTPFDVTVTWREPAMDAGEIWYGLVEFGTDRRRADNAKALFVKIRRV